MIKLYMAFNLNIKKKNILKIYDNYLIYLNDIIFYYI